MTVTASNTSAMDRHRTTIILVVASVLLFGAVVVGSRLCVSIKRERIVQLQQERSALEDRVRAHEELPSRVAELREQVSVLEAALPAEVEIGPLLEQLGDDLGSLNASERSLTTEPPVRTSDILRIPLKVSFDGPFDSVFDLIERLHSYERIVRVKRLSVRRDPARPAAPHGKTPPRHGGQVQVNVDMMTFAKVTDAPGRAQQEVR